MAKRTACVHANIHPNKAGKLVQAGVWRCLCPMPQLPPLPASMTKDRRFKPEFPRVYVEREDCAACPLWAPREVKTGD